jgi:signal transduction histidine kinase
VVIAVHDDGPGIPPPQREHIFERGVRADEKTAGQGLGLSLVRELAVGHYGGSVSVGNAPLGGALVTVRLDVALR